MLQEELPIPFYYFSILKNAPYLAHLKAWYPSAGRFTCLPDYIIVIPARNEENSIEECLTACKHAMKQSNAYGRILLVINNNEDKTAEKALHFVEKENIALDCILIDFPEEKAFPGIARALGFELAATMLGPRGLLITTDADSIPEENFITGHLAAFATGAALICGNIKLHNANLTKEYLKKANLENQYALLCARLENLIDPDPFNPWPHHNHKSGANLALTIHAFGCIGGMPKIGIGEDRALVTRVINHDLPVVYSTQTNVLTSCRLTNCCPLGMGETVKRRMEEGDFYCDEDLECANATLKRLQIRSALRELWHKKSDLQTILDTIGLTEEQKQYIEKFYTFGAMWSYIEDKSPYLQKVPLKVSALDDEIAFVKAYLTHYEKIAQTPMITKQKQEENYTKHFISAKPQFA